MTRGAILDLGQVHPRERGEAAGAPDGGEGVAGPSPRARGSRTVRAADRPSLGSIPASAGKPKIATQIVAGGGSIPASAGKPGALVARLTGAAVHPRERGEASSSTAVW